MCVCCFCFVREVSAPTDATKKIIFAGFGAKRTSWAPWIFTIKPGSVFCRRAKSSAKDRVLCLDIVTVVEHSEGEVTIRFSEGSDLHLRSSRHPGSPGIEIWTKAFNQVVKSAQDKKVV